MPRVETVLQTLRRLTNNPDLKWSITTGDLHVVIAGVDIDIRRQRQPNHPTLYKYWVNRKHHMTYYTWITWNTLKAHLENICAKNTPSKN